MRRKGHSAASKPTASAPSVVWVSAAGVMLMLTAGAGLAFWMARTELKMLEQRLSELGYLE